MFKFNFEFVMRMKNWKKYDLRTYVGVQTMQRLPTPDLYNFHRLCVYALLVVCIYYYLLKLWEKN